MTGKSKATDGALELEWREITAVRSDEDPRREPTGDYEADTPFGPYYIEQYFGSDSYGWYVSFADLKVADKDDPEAAKAAAQADFDARIRSSLAALPPAASAELANEALRRLEQLANMPLCISLEQWSTCCGPILAALNAFAGLAAPPQVEPAEGEKP